MCPRRKWFPEHSRLTPAFIGGRRRAFRLQFATCDTRLAIGTADDALPALRKIIIALLSLGRTCHRRRYVISPRLGVANEHRRFYRGAFDASTKWTQYHITTPDIKFFSDAGKGMIITRVLTTRINRSLSFLSIYREKFFPHYWKRASAIARRSKLNLNLRVWGPYFSERSRKAKIESGGRNISRDVKLQLQFRSHRTRALNSPDPTPLRIRSVLSRLHFIRLFAF